MEYPSPVSWTPTVLFALLGAFLLQKAVRRKARQSWGWGRVGGEVPLSRVSYAICGLTLIDVGALLAWGEKPPIALVVIFLIGFVSILIAGTRDTVLWRRAHPPQDSAARQPDEKTPK